MATIGYGDYFPCTYLGKILSFLMCLWGIFFVSITFVSLINLIQLSSNEQNAFNLIQKMKYNELYLKACSKVIIASIRFKIMFKKRHSNTDIISRFLLAIKSDNLKKAIINLQILKKFIY